MLPNIATQPPPPQAATGHPIALHGQVPGGQQPPTNVLEAELISFD